MAKGYYTDIETGKVYTKEESESISKLKPLDETVKFGTTTITPTTKVRISSGRGGSSGSRTSTTSTINTEQQRIAEQQRLAEQQRIAEQQRLAEQERRRIENLKRSLVSQGGSQRTQTSRDSQTGNPLKIETVKKGSNKIQIVTNIATGEKRYNVFGTGRGGGSTRLQSSVTTYQQGAKEVEAIKKELTSAGLKPVIRNNQVIGFISSETGNGYKYTEEGISKYNKDIQTINKQTINKQTTTEKVIKFGTKVDEKISANVSKVKNYFSNKLKLKGINVNNNETVKFINNLVNYYKKKGITTIKEVRELAKAERSKIERKLSVFSRSVNFKKPTTYPMAVAYAKNFHKYITYRSALTALDLGIATPEILKQIKKAPIETILSLPPAIISGFKEDFKTVKSGDPMRIADLITDYITYTVAFNVAGSTVRATTRNLIKLLPGTKKLVNGKIVVRKGGGLLNKKELILKSQTVSSGAKPLSVQAQLAGKEVTAVTAQANQLFSLIKNKKIIRKPIMGEANFPSNIKRLLSKFDSGKKLTNKEFATVNMWLRKNVAPNITLLERSLYLDPASGLRISRLGITPDRTAGLRDILRGNFRLWNRNKPQIIVFENAKIAKFPKSLASIKKKLQTGKPLTEAELNKLIKWQVQTGSGKFKPIGSTIYAGGRELEITLAPGELIKRVKRLGRIYIEGKKVTIVSAEVYKPSLKIIKQMKLAHLGKLTKQELKKLETFLSKQLGRKIKVETPELTKKLSRMTRRFDDNVPILRLSGSGIRVLARGLRRLGSPARRITGTSRRTPRVISGRRTGRIVRPNRVTRTGRVTRPGRTPPIRIPSKPRILYRPGKPPSKTGFPYRPGKPGTTYKPPRSPPGKPPITPALRISDFKSKTLSKPVQTYYVVEKVRGKFKKLYPKPLTAQDAKDFAVYSIDNKLSRTAFFVPLGKTKKVVRPPKQIQSYYSRNSKKVRPYRIRFGKKKQLVNGYIEKRKYFQDTVGERRSLRTARRMSPARRKVVLKNLAKARAVRRRNLLKRGRR